MRSLLMFIYSIIAYLIGFASLLFWILSTSHLIPAISIDRSPEIAIHWALLKNIGLVLLFGLQHSIMARPVFKNWFTRVMPRPIERSTYVLISGLLLVLLVWQWEPMGGNVWSLDTGSTGYYIMYTLFFLGWIILFISTFLINHFDLFVLRQTYFELTKKPYTNLEFRITGFYKYVRHPLYFGGILGIWATPEMSMTHLSFAILLTSYFVIGTLFEERDLRKEFGDLYREYSRKTPMLIPLTKFRKDS